MAVEKRFNLVTFRPDGQSRRAPNVPRQEPESGVAGGLDADRLYLSIDGEWTIQGGLSPSCNAAVVPASEVAKLADPPVDVRGAIEFWYTQAPGGGGSPDVTLEGWYLVDVAPEQVGRSPGESSDSVKTFRLCFADHRHGFVEPRGARLTHGELNPNPPPPGSVPYTNRELILQCLEAMNYPGSPPVDPAIVPATVDEVPPPRPVVWTGAHAPTELAQLLKHAGHVYVPRSDGTGSIFRPNFGNLPAIPSDRLSSVLVASSVDRRPRKVVITSAPVAKVQTYGTNTVVPPAWRFVAQDHADDMRWKPLGQIAALGGSFSAAVDAFRRGLESVPAEWRDHYRRQMFKALQLDPGLFPPRQCAILRKVFYPAGQYSGRTDDPYCKLIVATRDTDGAWVNRLRAVKASSIVAREGVMVFEDRLGGVKANLNDPQQPDPLVGEEYADLEPHFVPAHTIDSTEAVEEWLRPTFSVESWDGDRKAFAAFGFERVGLDLVPMDNAGEDDVAQEHLAGYRPDTAIYSCPELRQITSYDTVADPVENRTQLHAVAQAYAGKLAVETADAVAQTAIVKGFFPVELDGRVSEVRFSQAECRTTLVVNGWHVPTGPASDAAPAGGEPDVLSSSAAPTKQPNRSVRGADSMQVRVNPISGEGGQLPPSAAVAPDRTVPTGFRPIIVEVVAAVSGQTGRYTAKSFSGRVDVAAAGNVTKALLGSQSPNADCHLMWFGDVAAASPGSLKAGDIVFGLAASVRADQAICVVATGPKLKKVSIVTNVSCANGVITQTKEDFWVWDA